MSIASEITRLQGVKSDILTAIADKGVTVPAGSMLDDCPDLITSIPTGGNDDVIAIGEFTYETVVIGQLRWTKKDLKSVVTGVNYPATLKWDTGAGCVYYNNDTATYGIYGEDRGLLYNCKAGEIIQNFLNNNLPGWRIATVDDWNSLVNFAGGGINAYKKLCAPRLWSNTSDMTDEYGFSAIPTGTVVSGNFDEEPSAKYFAAPISNPITNAMWIDSSQNYKFWIGNFNYNYEYCAIRLCKDA